MNPHTGNQKIKNTVVLSNQGYSLLKKPQMKGKKIIFIYNFHLKLWTSIRKFLEHTVYSLVQFEIQLMNWHIHCKGSFKKTGDVIHSCKWPAHAQVPDMCIIVKGRKRERANLQIIPFDKSIFWYDSSIVLFQNENSNGIKPVINLNTIVCLSKGSFIPLWNNWYRFYTII